MRIYVVFAPTPECRFHTLHGTGFYSFNDVVMFPEPDDPDAGGINGYVAGNDEGSKPDCSIHCIMLEGYDVVLGSSSPSGVGIPELRDEIQSVGPPGPLPRGPGDPGDEQPGP